MHKLKAPIFDKFVTWLVGKDVVPFVYEWLGYVCIEPIRTKNYCLFMAVAVLVNQRF